MPNYSWSISRSLDSLGSGLTIGDTTKGFIRIFNINRTDYNPPWDLNKEQAQVEQDFNVIEKGDIYFKGKKSKWNLVFYDQDLPQTYSLYLTYLDEENKKIFTLDLTTENVGNIKQNLCTLEPLIKTFKIKTGQNNGSCCIMTSIHIFSLAPLK